MRECRSLEMMRTWHQDYGNTFQTILGRTLIVTIEPENIRAILSRKFEDFDLGHFRNKSLEPLLGTGIFTSDGEAWKHSRALVRPNFQRNLVADVEVYEKHVSKLISCLPKDGSMVDLQDLFFRMTIDSATEFLFGESVDSLDCSSSEGSDLFAQNFDISQKGLAIRTRLGPLMFLYRDKKFFQSTVEARQYVHRFVQKAIAYRAAVDAGAESEDLAPRYVFLHELSKQTQDQKALTDQLLNILLAGRDTTASLLTTTFFILARRPDVWKKLRAEVLILKGRRPSFEDLKSLKYLKWVINESLRLYPPVPVNSRTANKDTFLPVGGGPGGNEPLFVPKGRKVLYSIYCMHRLPELFGLDATEFRPERWENLKPTWEFIPFNGGPRICIGQQFALTETAYTVVRILQEFRDIESRDPQPFNEKLTLIITSKNGCKVSLTPS
ncbi:uncharacterized protein BHQ10_000671 [Talaromyces amestolkiae]|uniref:Cytochrome P450 n=1 Tax=Talaromyces amestolkiae TaxID=1196081 RepID=A0A364KM84_TALAM|nr:uncharacterized protein BHQ10_000671 [Talaromyces amestolkiae]RAO64659.1 hypothetical protein BHQ10_000671 [Talaromyces amestolkiae]